MIAEMVCSSEAKHLHDTTTQHSSSMAREYFHHLTSDAPERYDAQRDNRFGSEGNLHGGNDTFYGSAGWDKVYGGYGNDRIYTYEGDDELYGWFDNDTLSSGVGNDTLYGGGGNDRLIAGSEDDELLGETGHDVLYGQWGEDSLDGGADHDRLYGGNDNDTLEGGSGRDTLIGGSGNDLLRDASGQTSFVGGGGADTFVVNSNQRHSVIRDFKDIGDKVELDFGDWNQMRAMGIRLGIEGNDFVYFANDEAVVTIKGAMNQFRDGNLRLVSGGWEIA